MNRLKMIIYKIKNSEEKNLIIYKNIIGSFVIKGGALAISLLLMPAYIHYFKDTRILGIWFTILSILIWIFNFDLGLGNGLRNSLVVAFEKKDMILAKSYISSAYFLIGLLVGIFTIIGYFILGFLNWNYIFNVPVSLISSNALRSTIQFTFLGVMIQFLLRFISYILYAMQLSAITNMLSLSTSVMQLIFVLIAPSNSSVRNLEVFSVAYIFCANIPLMIATVFLFAGPLKKCRPSVKNISLIRAKKVLSLGGIFFACQILYMIILNTNEFFISHFTSPANVVNYQIYYKLFSIISMVFMLMLTPVWSTVSKAIFEKDFRWLIKLYNNLMRLAVLASIIEFFLILILQFVINIWLGSSAITVNYVYAIIFALFGTAMIFQDTVSTIASGIGDLKVQFFSYSIGTVVKFIVIIIGIRLTNSWIIIVISNVVVLTPYVIWQNKSLKNYFLENRGQKIREES
ncbi:lipopolysaccharide biosynthesis protein [Liquorilactobacillus hordei]|uniref:lipopolysaccharide biosynthesis protein n=1 Tax=Liquorilactobacillus hordei TaxID=468911 RepID=UPI0039EBE8EB